MHDKLKSQKVFNESDNEKEDDIFDGEFEGDDDGEEVANGWGEATEVDITEVERQDDYTSTSLDTNPSHNEELQSVVASLSQLLGAKKAINNNVPASKGIKLFREILNNIIPCINTRLKYDDKLTVGSIIELYATTANIYEFIPNPINQPTLVLDFSIDFSVMEFLEEDSVIALARIEYARLTRQDIGISNNELSIIPLHDQKLVNLNPEALIEITDGKIKRGIDQAVAGTPSFFIISNNGHWALVALLPDGKNGEVQVVYMNSAYGRDAEGYYACKLVGLDSCRAIVALINERRLHDDQMRPPIEALHIFLEPSQQIKNNCGSVTGLNVAGIAAWIKVGRIKPLTDFLGSLEYNRILAKQEKDIFENYVKARFAEINPNYVESTAPLSPASYPIVQLKSVTINNAQYEYMIEQINADKERFENTVILSKGEIEQQRVLYKFYEELKKQKEKLKQESAKPKLEHSNLSSASSEDEDQLDINKLEGENTQQGNSGNALAKLGSNDLDIYNSNEVCVKAAHILRDKLQPEYYGETTIKLRDAQKIRLQQWCDSVIENRLRSHVFEMPTGTGKTLAFAIQAEAIVEARGKVLILTSGAGLKDQIVKEFEKIGSEVQIMMVGGKKRKGEKKCPSVKNAEDVNKILVSSNVIIMTYQMYGILAKKDAVPYKSFAHIITDEAHKAIAVCGKYKETIAQYHCGHSSYTATPEYNIKVKHRDLHSVYDLHGFKDKSKNPINRFTLDEGIREGITPPFKLGFIIGNKPPKRRINTDKDIEKLFDNDKGIIAQLNSQGLDLLMNGKDPDTGFPFRVQSWIVNCVSKNHAISFANFCNQIPIDKADPDNRLRMKYAWNLIEAAKGNIPGLNKILKLQEKIDRTDSEDASLKALITTVQKKIQLYIDEAFNKFQVAAAVYSGNKKATFKGKTHTPDAGAIAPALITNNEEDITDNDEVTDDVVVDTEVTDNDEITDGAVIDKAEVHNNKELIEKHSLGGIMFLANVDMLKEGYNDPKVSVLNLAPTKSKLKVQQQGGRAARICEFPEYEFISREHFQEQALKYLLKAIQPLRTQLALTTLSSSSLNSVTALSENNLLPVNTRPAYPVLITHDKIAYIIEFFLPNIEQVLFAHHLLPDVGTVFRAGDFTRPHAYQTNYVNKHSALPKVDCGAESNVCFPLAGDSIFYPYERTKLNRNRAEPKEISITLGSKRDLLKVNNAMNKARNNSSITSISIFGSRKNYNDFAISLDIEQVQAIADMLKVSESITYLSLRGNILGIKGSELIGDALKHNASLTSLDLRLTGLGETEGKVIVEGLKINRSLTSIDFRDNNLREVGRAISGILVINRSIISLDLRNTNLSHYRAEEIEKALKINRELSSKEEQGSHQIGGVLSSSDAQEHSSTTLNVDNPVGRFPIANQATDKDYEDAFNKDVVEFFYPKFEGTKSRESGVQEQIETDNAHLMQEKERKVKRKRDEHEKNEMDRDKGEHGDRHRGKYEHKNKDGRGERYSAKDEYEESSRHRNKVRRRERPEYSDRDSGENRENTRYDDRDKYRDREHMRRRSRDEHRDGARWRDREDRSRRGKDEYREDSRYRDREDGSRRDGGDRRDNSRWRDREDRGRRGRNEYREDSRYRDRGHEAQRWR